MDIELLKKVHINYYDGLKRFANKPEFYYKYLKKFIDDPTFEALEKAMSQHNYDTAFREAHTMKGMVGNLSMDGLYNSINPFVESLRHKEFENIESEYAKVKSEYEIVVEALKKI